MHATSSDDFSLSSRVALVTGAGRGIGRGIALALARVGAAVGTYLVPLSLETLGTAQTMYAAALVTLLGLLVTWALAPETRSLNLQQAASLT